MPIGLFRAMICSLVLQIAVAANVYADSMASIVLGSYINRDSATSRLQELASQLDLSLQIVKANVRGTRYFRIISTPVTDISRARAEMEKIRVTVEPDAWLLIEQRRVIRHLSTDTDAGSSIHPSPAEHGKAEQAVDLGKQDQQTDPRPPSMHPAEAGTHVPGKPTASSTKRVAILPLTISAEEDLSFLEDGIPSMLMSRLSWKDNVVVLDRGEIDAVMDALDHPITEDHFRDIGNRLDADFLLSGSLTVLGDHLRIDMKVTDAKGPLSVRIFFRESRSMNDVIPHINDLAEEINSKVFGRIHSMRDRAKPSSAQTDSIYTHPERLPLENPKPSDPESE